MPYVQPAVTTGHVRAVLRPPGRISPKCHVSERSGLLPGTDVTPDRRGQYPHARKDRVTRCQNTPQIVPGGCTLHVHIQHVFALPGYHKAACRSFSVPRTLTHASQRRRQGGVREYSGRKAGNGIRRGGTGRAGALKNSLHTSGTGTPHAGQCDSCPLRVPPSQSEGMAPKHCFSLKKQQLRRQLTGTPTQGAFHPDSNPTRACVHGKHSRMDSKVISLPFWICEKSGFGSLALRGTTWSRSWQIQANLLPAAQSSHPAGSGSPPPCKAPWPRPGSAPALFHASSALAPPTTPLHPPCLPACLPAGSVRRLHPPSRPRLHPLPDSTPRPASTGLSPQPRHFPLRWDHHQPRRGPRPPRPPGA